MICANSVSIIRIITMVPVYVIFAWMSFMFYRDSVYLTIAELVWEAVAVASFYMLMCSWIAPSHAFQIEFFATRKAPKWKVLSWFGVRSARSGISWFNICSVLVLQYTLMRPLLALIGIVTQATRRYCLESLSPSFAHLWVQILSLLSVLIAMFGLINFFAEMRKDLAIHRPASKLLALKMVVFFTFWQTVSLRPCFPIPAEMCI